MSQKKSCAQVFFFFLLVGVNTLHGSSKPPFYLLYLYLSASYSVVCVNKWYTQIIKSYMQASKWYIICD